MSDDKYSADSKPKTLSYLHAFDLVNMATITDLDVQEIRKFFEENLNQAQRADKRQKMRMRRKMRDEVFNLLTWEKPTPSAIMNRWEERLQDAFKVMPYSFKEELFKLLVAKMQHPLRMGKSR